MARLKRQPKKGGSAHPGIAKFIQQLQDVQQHELPALLEPLLQSGWQWPRTDMQHWIHPLNRFDEILETIVRDYDLGSMQHAQTNDFTPRTKELLLSVLAFQKLLLENSTNRKIFNGFDRINDLLHTSDITVLLATLRLALRPAQQYSSYNSSLSSIAFSDKRLLSLAQPWGTREHGIDLVKTAQDGALEIPLEMQEPEWQFYRKADPAAVSSETATDEKAAGHEMEVEEPVASTSAGLSTPAPPRRTASFAPHLQTPSRETLSTPGLAGTPATPAAPSAVVADKDKPQEGLTTIHLPNLRTTTKSAVDILLDLVETHHVPEADRLDLLQRIRIGKALCSSDAHERQQLLVVRLLALAVFSHAQSEQVAQLKVFLYEPDVIAQVAELVHPETELSIGIKSVGLYALEAFARYKGKTAEVASALNASVSHGVLMELVRKTAADLDFDTPETIAEFIDALFIILTFFNMHQSIGQMAIGAGIINVLLDFVKISHRGHLQMIAANKAIVILDGFLYGYTNAFTAFIAADGLNALIGRIQSEVDGAVDQYREEADKLETSVTENSTGLLTFQQGTLLKSILRAVHRLMTTSGTTEGLRNLIDTSLLASVKKVIEHRFIFGPQVFSLVTNIAATFVHNEPTSLATLQEAKVPDALYDSLELAIPASNDVLQAVPNAIGAFCLNQAGLDHFLKRDLIAKYFGIFTSPAHFELLRDRDSAVNLGAAIDELVRHHPTLKTKILDVIFDILREFKRMGAAFVPPAGEQGYGLLPATAAETAAAPGAPEDVAMNEGAPAPEAPRSSEDDQAAKDQKKAAEEEKVKDNEVTNAIDVFGRFLEGLFQNIGHVQDFVDHADKAFDLLLDLLELPCSPAIVLKNGGFSSIVAIFRISTETKAPEALTAILARTEKWLEATKWFWEIEDMQDGDRKSTLAAMVQPSAYAFEAQQKRFRDLTILLSHVTLLSDVFTNLSYAHGKAATAILTVFTVKGPQSEVLERIGKVYRSCLWENVSIRPTSFWSGEASKAATEQLVKDAPQDPAPTPAVAVARERQQEQAADIAAHEVISTPATPDSPNIKLVQDVVQAFTRMTLPLYQTIVKLLVHRRTPDASHRKVSRAVAGKIAGFMRDTLAWPEARDLPANLAYSAQSLVLITKILIDERPNSLQTLLLQQFVLVGGSDAYIKLFNKLLAVSSESFESAGESATTASPLIIPVFGALKTALDFLGRITAQKTVFEATQTGLLISRESDPKSPDYLDAPALLVRLRHDSFPALQSAWEQPWLRKCPQNVIRSLVSTLINVLKGEGEAPSEAPARPEAARMFDMHGAPIGGANSLLNALDAVFGGVVGGGGGGAGMIGGGPAAGTAARSPAAQAPALDQTRVTQLIDMGFPRLAAERALRRCRNNVPLATEYLLQHPDVVGAAIEEEARQLLEPAAAASDGEGAAAASADQPAEGAAAGNAAAGPSTDTTAETSAATAGEQAAAPADPVPSTSDVAMTDVQPTGAAAPVVEAEMPEAAPVQPSGPSADEMRASLKASRQEVAPHFVSRALELAEEYSDLVFDVKAVFGQINVDENDRNATKSLKALLDDLRARASAASDEKPAAAAARLRLIALLATDAAFRETVEPVREEIMAVAMLFQAKYAALSPAKDGRPIWLAPFMLVTDAMLSISSVPVKIDILAESNATPAPIAKQQGPSWAEERRQLFETAADLLDKGVSTREIFISTLRLLLFLTRDADFAARFIERGGLRTLVMTFAVEAPETKNCQSYATMILRHLVEEKALLKPMMEREIEAWFAGTRSKVADASGFVRGVGAIANRDFDAFLEAATSTVKLVQADAPAHYHITLQRDPAQQGKPAETEELKSPLGQDAATEGADVGIQDAGTATKGGAKAGLTPASSTTESVVHLLMQQALDLVKPALAPIPPAAASQPAGPSADGSAAADAVSHGDNASEPAPKKDAKDAHIPADVPLGDFYQSAFSLATLAELVASYSSCKSAFFTFSTRKGASKEAVAGRSRSSFLYFLLSELVPTSCLVPNTDFDSKRIASMWGWASLVLVGLCYDATAASLGHGGDKDLAADITFVRKAVLDAVARAFRDAMSSSEPTEVRYSRLASLSDLCHRLLTARPFPSVGRTHSETSMLLAKLMLEKNFAVILTNALAEVDLNFPHVNQLINAILRPLENLTKIATKLGRAKGAQGASGASKKREMQDLLSSDEDSSMLSGDDSESDESGSDGEAQDQAAADLYRHSALGMYEGELEQGHGEEYMSGDEDAFDDDDEMMEEMDDFDGSDVSDASDDDDDDDEDGGEGRAFSDADMEELADEDEADLDTDDEGSAIHADDVEEEIILEADEDGEPGDELEALEAGFEDEEGDWIDAEDEEGMVAGDGGDRNQMLFVDDGGGPIRDADDEDDIDDGGESEGGFTDEEEVLTGELEFDPEMTEQLRAQSTAQAYGWDPVTGGDGSSNRRGRSTAEDMLLSDAMFDRPQVPPRTAPDHPLLTEAAAAESRADGPPRRPRGNNATSRESAAYQEWVRSVEAMLGPGGVNTLQEVLGAQGLGHLSGPDQLRIQLAPGPNGGMAVVIDPSPGLRAGHAGHAGHAAHHEHRASPAASAAPQTARSIARQLSDRINAASAFLPMQTSQRWHEEREILQGCYLVSERSARTTNHVINALHPAARAEAKAEKLKTEEKRKKELEEEAAAKKQQEEEDAAKQAAADTAKQTDEAAASMEVDSSDPVAGAAAVPDVPDDVAEVMNLARSLAAGLAVPAVSEAPSATPSRQPTPAVPSTSAQGPSVAATGTGSAAGPQPGASTEAHAEASGSGAGSSAPAPASERVTVLVHGEEVDITDTGIDREFLEALPDDMRDEVISQHFRENRIRSSGPPPAVPSSISAEFLDALPPALRAEVMRTEAEDLRRQQQAAPGVTEATPAADAAGRAAQVPGGGAADAPVDFLAGLDAQVRDAVYPAAGAGGLIDNLLNPAPPRGGAHRYARRGGASVGPGGGMVGRRGRGGPGGIELVDDEAPVPKKPTSNREVIQLLDKAGLATLVRLLFFPHPLKRGLLQKVLVNLCENTRTRVELVNLLLTILQDGTRDVSAVDKSFSQMSLRASRALAPKDTPKRKAPETPGNVLPHLPGESVPNLIAQRCLDALVFLVSANEQTPLYFLSEQELPMSRRAAKKGKGKEKAAPITTYPIVVLLGLLERPGLLKTPAMMEAVMSLLASISRSLQVLQKKTSSTDADKKEADAAPPPAESSEAATSAAAASAAAADANLLADKDKEKEKDVPAAESKEAIDLSKNPPSLPTASLRLVVNVLDAGECSSRTFSSTLSLIQNLSNLSGARDTILDELKARAEKISTEIVPHLANLLNTVNRDETVGGVLLGNFTPASSSQAKLLRILKTIDFFGTPPKKSASQATGKPASQSLSPEEEQIKAIYSSLASSDLWKRLGDALGGIEAKPDLLYLSTVLLPLIESLLVVNKFTDASSTEFIDFTTAHSKILNTMVRNNPSLMSGSFAVLVRNSSMLDFENKRSFFFSRLHDRTQRSRPHYPTINLNVRRARVFEDSYHVFQRRSGEEIKYGKLNVKFYDEEGVDAGGVTREWFGVLARQMFNPGYALFQPQAADALTYQPNKSSAINEYHLEYFRFVGRIIGKAIYDQRLLEAYFSRSVYKHMLGKQVDHRDLESIDPEYYKSLVWMLDNDIDGIIDLTFSVERDEFGVVEVVDLIPNGRNIAVTNENKHEYVRKIAEQRLSIEIKDQITALLRGLYEVVPKDLLQIFSERELELLISGLPDIDVDEWRSHTDLVGYSSSDPVVGYFWRAVRSFDGQQRAALLQFVSGTSRVPLEGFGSLQGMNGTTRFNIHKAATGTNSLPTAHTCFNQLDLPTYVSYEDLRKQLLTAITEGATGFAFA